MPVHLSLSCHSIARLRNRLTLWITEQHMAPLFIKWSRYSIDIISQYNCTTHRTFAQWTDKLMYWKTGTLRDGYICCDDWLCSKTWLRQGYIAKEGGSIQVYMHTILHTRSQRKRHRPVLCWGCTYSVEKACLLGCNRRSCSSHLTIDTNTGLMQIYGTYISWSYGIYLHVFASCKLMLATFVEYIEVSNSRNNVATL